VIKCASEIRLQIWNCPLHYGGMDVLDPASTRICSAGSSLGFTIMHSYLCSLLWCNPNWLLWESWGLLCVLDCSWGWLWDRFFGWMQEGGRQTRLLSMGILPVLATVVVTRGPSEFYHGTEFVDVYNDWQPSVQSMKDLCNDPSLL